MLVSDAYIASALGIISFLLMGMRQPAINSLTIEQIPEIRGSIMSLSSASSNIGSLIGSTIASILLVYGWIPTGLFLTSASILSSFILLFFAEDPMISGEE